MRFQIFSKNSQNGHRWARPAPLLAVVSVLGMVATAASLGLTSTAASASAPNGTVSIDCATLTATVHEAGLARDQNGNVDRNQNFYLYLASDYPTIPDVSIPGVTDAAAHYDITGSIAIETGETSVEAETGYEDAGYQAIYLDETLTFPACPAVSPSPTPTPTTSPSPNPTATPHATPVATPTATATPTPSSGHATPTPSPTTAPTITPQPTTTATASPGFATDPHLSSSTVTLGGTTTVTAGGFTPGELVTAVLHSTPVALGNHTANSAGTVSFEATIPSNLETGTHSITLLGTQSGVTATIPLTVTNPTTTSAVDAADLAHTGVHSLWIGGSGLALLAIGGASLLFAQRRRTNVGKR